MPSVLVQINLMQMRKNEEKQNISGANNNYLQSSLTRKVKSMIQLVIRLDKRRYKLKLQLLFPYYYKRHLNIQVCWPLPKSPESWHHRHEIPSSESTFLIFFCLNLTGNFSYS